MKRGKQTCKILKEIRQQIAEANDIEFITSECQYQGDCLGTCPKCESEVRYLEQQLERKRLTGKTITILGISTGLVTMCSMTSCNSAPNKGTSQNANCDTVQTINSQDSTCDVMFGDIAPNVKKDTIQMKINNNQETPSHEDKALVTLGEIDITDEHQTHTSSYTANDTLDIAEVMPEFPGGVTGLMKFITENINYPKELSDKGIDVQGRVIIKFIVNKEGDIINPKVIRSIDPYLDKEALRIVNLMPKWKPGELKDGTKVAVRYTIPVMFRLQ